MTNATLLPPTDPPLTESHRRELAAATERSKAIRKVARVATFNAWTTAILATLSAPFALTGMSGVLVFLALAVIAWNEFRGRRRLLDYDPAGASILGWNQLGLLAVITVYCLWALYSNLAELQTNREIGAALNSLGGTSDLVRPIVIAFYGAVIALSAVFQGGNALYYFSRRKVVEKYVRETPAWVIDLQRATQGA